jgi:hypothetical protein
MAEQFIQQKAVPEIKKWLEACRRDHPSCSQGARHANIFCTDNTHSISDISSDGLVPTRLLDLSLLPISQEDDIIKVMPSASLRSNTDYVALSHRWGQDEQCKLSRANYDKLTTDGLKVADLPLTYRESVELCRGLGMPFLWIDSLCIIQDDLDDWKNEARRMAIIYDKATLTIAAVDGIDSSKGLHILDPADAEFATLSTRAWVCQEDMISPRTVLFTSGTVLWDCREAESKLSSTELRPRPIEYLEPVPVYPKDVFCFFRDWRLPRLARAREENDSPVFDQKQQPQAVAIITSSTPETELHETNDIPAKNSDGGNDVLCLQGPLTDEERQARRGQSFVEVVPNPDGTDTIHMYYGDDIASHAAHIANHQMLTGEHLSYNVHPKDWDPKDPEPFGDFKHVVTNLLRPEKDYEPFLKVWWQFVSLYTRRQLSFPSDRFLAINGVTTVAQRWTHMRSTFGLWYHFLVSELVWHVSPRTKAKRPSLWIAPSWTWASTLEGMVVNHWYQRLPVRPLLMLKPEIGTPIGTSFDQVLPIESWKKTKYRSITLKGDLRRGLVTREQKSSGELGYSMVLEDGTRLTMEDNEKMFFVPDCEEEWPIDKDIPILSLLIHHYDGLQEAKPESRDVCLVLRRAKVEGDETSLLDVSLQEILSDDRNFMRVGYLEIVYPAETRKPWKKIWEDIWWREVVLM